MKELSALKGLVFSSGHYCLVENLLIVLLVKESINKDVLMKEQFFFLFTVMVVTIFQNKWTN